MGRAAAGRWFAVGSTVAMFERIAEKAIAEAMREGKFDNLPNAGRPLDLENYFKAPEIALPTEC